MLVMNPILYAIPVFMLLIVAELAWAHWRRGNRTPGADGRPRPIYELADALSSMQIGILSRIAMAFPRLLTVGLYALVVQQFSVTTWDMANPVHWLGALVLYDFLYYWKHRANHEVRIMWAGHITHHNSEYFNLSTALRQSSTTFVFDWMFYMPMALLGVPVQMWIAVALIDLLYQFWVHTELVGRLGWFDRIFVSPSNHRVHHGQDSYCVDTNYGGILIIWDRVFGTYAEEGPTPVTFGVRTPLRSFNPLWGNLHEYAAIWRDVRQARGLPAKLEALWTPPSGWSREKLGPFDARQAQRHQVPVSPRMRSYALAQHVLNVFWVCWFLYRFPAWPASTALLVALWLVAGLVAPTAMLEGRPWGRRLEWGRCLLAPLVLAIGLGLWPTGGAA